MWSERLFKFLSVVIFALTITACGGGGSTTDTTPPEEVPDGGNPVPVQTAIGQFKDSNVEGLGYLSGAERGVTDANGNFRYEVGNTVSFFVGGVSIGSVAGKAVITPVDMVANGTISNPSVLNLVRFLMMLDNDGNPANGILIDSAIQTIAETWPQVDFSASDFASELTTIIPDAALADGRTHLLPSILAARAHIESTFSCLYAGAYNGTFNGDDNGNFAVVVDAINGIVSGVAYSIPFQQYIGLFGTSAINFEDNSFVSGNATSGASFVGSFNSLNSMSGSWANSPDSGSFTGERIGGVADAAYRFTGVYLENAGRDAGIFAFDLDGDNNIIGGFAYSAGGDQSLELNGSVSGTQLSATSSDGTVISGTLNTATGTLFGSWNDAADGLEGNFSGNGCALNPTPTAEVESLGTPTEFAATSGDAQVSLTWNAVAGATSYNLYFAEQSFGSPVNTAGAMVANITNASHVVSGLANGTSYYFVVVAVGADGEGLPSIEILETPTAPDVPEPPTSVYGSLTLTSDSRADSIWVPTAAVGFPSTNSFTGQWFGEGNSFMQIAHSINGSLDDLATVSFRTDFSVITLWCLSEEGVIGASLCSGVIVDPVAKTVSFSNVRMAEPNSGSIGNIFTLNGTLRY